MRVWYAAYGSNLSRSRFDTYLRGGIPTGATHEYPGCRDGSDPVDDRAWSVGRELVFGGTSHTWGGGVAFLDGEHPSETKLRLYLVSIEQFEDVVAQENWLPCGAVRLSDAVDTDIGAQHTYGLVLRLGEVDRIPVLTVTRHAGAESAAPSPEYLRHIAEGLREAHGLSNAEVVDYLMSKRGVMNEFSYDELGSVVA